jgi:four helix bundle protein
MRDYRKIEACRLSDDLAAAVYNQTQTFPREELYGLTEQPRRSAISVPANIDEGSARHSNGDYLHLLHLARGSLGETQYCLHLTRRLDFSTDRAEAELATQGRATFACLHGLICAAEAEARETNQSGYQSTRSLTIQTSTKVPHPGRT